MGKLHVKFSDEVADLMMATYNENQEFTLNITRIDITTGKVEATFKPVESK